MALLSPHDSSTTNDLLCSAARGDRRSLGVLLDRDRLRLLRMVALRLDPRVRGRVDPSDVLQEAQIEATRRLAEFLANPTMPFFLWMRLIAGQRVAQAHRHHLHAQRRDVDRELSLDRVAIPQASSAALAAHLLAESTSPSGAAIRAEMKARLNDALDSMEPIDREVLVLRHFEQLTATETAVELGIETEAAKKRHLRALRRLKTILVSHRE